MQRIMDEMFTIEDQPLISENQSDKQLLISTKRLQERQLVLEENNNIFNKLQYDVEQKLLTNKAESQLRSHFNKKYQKTLDIISEFIEIYNKIKYKIQLCLDDQKQFKICNKELSDAFNKYSNDSDRENKNDLAKLNQYSEVLRKLNDDHQIKIRGFQLKFNENEQSIAELNTAINVLQNDGDEINKVIESFSAKAKLLLDKHDTIFNDIAALKDIYETFMTNSEDEINQLVNELNLLRLSSDKSKESIRNKMEEITVLQKAFENQNDFICELKTKYDHLERSLLCYKQEKIKLESEINDLKDINGQESVDYNCKIVEIDVQSSDAVEQNQLIVEENEKLQQHILSLQSKIDELKVKMEFENKEFDNCETNLSNQNLLLEQNNNKYYEKVDNLKNILLEKDSAGLKLEQDFEIVNNEVAAINEQIQSQQNENNELLTTNQEKEINTNLKLDSIKEENKILQCSLKDLQTNYEELKLSENEKLQRLNDDFEEELSNICEEQNDIKTQCKDDENELRRELNKLKELFINIELQIIEMKTTKKNVEIELGLKIEEISKLDELKAKQDEDRKKERKLEELRIKQNEEYNMKERKRLEEQAIQKHIEVKKLKAIQNEEEKKINRLADLQNSNIKKQLELNLRKRKRLDDKTKQNVEENKVIDDNFELNLSVMNQAEQQLLIESIDQEYNYKMKEYALKEIALKECEKQAKEKAQKEFEKQQTKEKAQKELEKQLQLTGVQMSDLKDSITLLPKNPNPVFKKPIPRYSSSSFDSSDSSFDDEFPIGKGQIRFKTFRQSKKQAMSFRSQQDLDFDSLKQTTTPKKRQKRNVF